ncbi:hypothetical protein TUMSATVNIG1_54790 [Vibrio nigripulchritudo]|uniref:hypothetical protein n=1 Tax=Vibrio nigripulchritudo TaxID=28173 RepID=UPI00190E1F0B|nr:hypothetical protein [Vibrio nigripulchritudo]BCL73503.1 hypothetical protein VNTUMSATTG_54400 [Vibrio nigripulchritudo]BDU34870.1 hypothetical protein TUMSATVNIG1_54790 [Vibrio nigripulchritudo]
MSELLLSESELPSWFNYPREFLRIIDQGLLDFDPWIVLQGDQLRTRFKGLQERYPERELVPFARREDNDDVACWDKGKEGVVIIHDFSSSGYENKQYMNSFWDWLRSALEATIEYDGG